VVTNTDYASKMFMCDCY